MADDALIEEETPKAASNVATKEDLAQVTGSLKDFADKVTREVSALRQQVTPAQPKVETPAATGDELLDALVKDTRGTITQIAKDTMRDTLGPYLQSQISTQAADLQESTRKQMDSTYGAGTFDEVIAPKMEAIFQGMDAEAAVVARGSKQTYDSIRRMAMGDDKVMESLIERREKVKANPPEMLGDSRVRATSKATLTPEDNAWIEEYERTGQQLDRKALTQLLEHRSKNGSWNAQNMGGRNKLNLSR